MKMLASAKTINQGIGDGNITSMAMLAQQTAVSLGNGEQQVVTPMAIAIR